MRILLVNYMETTAPGGINRVVFETAKWLSKWGHKVVVFNPSYSEKIVEQVSLTNDSILIRGYPLRSTLYGLDVKNLKLIKRILSTFSPDIVHIHGYHSLFSHEVIHFIKFYSPKIPMIFSPHLDVSRSTFIGEYLWRFYNSLIGASTFRIVDHIISHSKFEAENITRLFGISKERISIIPHGVDNVSIKKPTRQKKRLYLVYSGYLIKRKRVDHILRTLHSLIYDFNIRDVYLIIIGEGPEKQALHKLAKTLNIQNNIIWYPFLRRELLIDIIKNADVLLLLSESEAYGITVAEALALGTPVIVSKKAALKEFLIEPGCFGVDYPPDPVEVASIILNITTTNIRVGPFSKRIRPWDQVVKDYENVYFSLLNSQWTYRVND
ncbi:glycosyltransferase family 1 protein [Thermococcus sp. 21S9]|nr:glycosyltransferase family 1 protein [Thermococcus sp. 21S9]